MRALALSSWRSTRRLVVRLTVCALGLLLLVSGCFFSPLPLPEDPAPERPNFNLSRAVPPVSQVLNFTRDKSVPISFTVPFTSVDGDEDVWWFLWANWGLEGVRYVRHDMVQRQADLDPGMGGASATERTIAFSWSPTAEVKPGCNQLTLFATHARNVNFVTLRPIDFAKAAMATYWLNVDAPLGEGQTLVNCPGAAFGP